MSFKLAAIISFSYEEGRLLENFAVNITDIVYFLSGKGTIIIKDTEYQYEQNTFLFMNANEKRSQKTTEYTDYICIRYIDSTHSIKNTSGVYQDKEKIFLKLFLELQKEYTNMQYHYFNYCNFYLKQIYIQLLRLQKQKPQLNDLDTIIQYINKSKGHIKTVRELANESPYSYDHFRHKFKKLTGQSPSDFIINRKLENARNLLKENKYNCAEIASRCGFSSEAQFKTVFKQRMGIFPQNGK